MTVISRNYIDCQQQDEIYLLFTFADQQFGRRERSAGAQSDIRLVKGWCRASLHHVAW
jgi:hypothetical protein